MIKAGMRRFWDRRASEDAFFFVDNRLEYRDPDLARFWEGGARDLDALLGALGVEIQPGDRVLEIGCGVGRLTRVLAARAVSVFALDVSPRMLELARQYNGHLAGITWILGDGCTLDGLESESFDVSVSHVVFQHIPDPAITLGYITELGRVLAPGGWAAFQISNDPEVHRPKPLAGRARRAALAAAGRGPKGQHHPNWLGSMVELGDVARAAAEGSMTIERVVGEGTQLCCVLARRELT